MNKQKVEGYIWMSDETSPRIIEEIDLDELKSENNPFINEGMFHTEDRSYIIKFSNGKQIITEASLTAEQDAIDEERIYCGHKIEGKDIKIVQRWRLKSNPNCQGKKEYVPAEIIFKGFIKKNEEDRK